MTSLFILINALTGEPYLDATIRSAMTAENCAEAEVDVNEHDALEWTCAPYIPKGSDR